MPRCIPFRIQNGPATTCSLPTSLTACAPDDEVTRRAAHRHMWFARFLLVPATAVAFVLPDPRRCAVPCMSSRSPTTTTLMAPTPSPVSVFDADGDELDAANAKEDIVQVVKSYYDQQYVKAAKQRERLDVHARPRLGRPVEHGRRRAREHGRGEGLRARDADVQAVRRAVDREAARL